MGLISRHRPKNRYYIKLIELRILEIASFLCTGGECFFTTITSLNTRPDLVTAVMPYGFVICALALVSHIDLKKKKKSLFANLF